MRKMNPSRPVGCMLLAALCMVWTGAARADVLSQVPADAAVVIKLNHVSDTNQKVAALLQQLGVTDLVPTMKDPLQALEDSSGFGAGIDPKGDVALFFSADDIASMPNNNKTGVILVPVSDYKAFVGSQTVVRTDNDITIMHTKDSETDVFVQQWGDYAAISQSKDELSVKHEGLTATGAVAKELAGDDFVLFVNVAALKPTLLPKLDDAEKQLVSKIQDSITDAGKQQVTVALAKELVQGAREFLNDAQGSAFGLTLGANGLKGNFTVDFAPDTYLGKLASTMKQTDESLLAGLPQQSYMFFGGFVQDPAWSGKLFDDVTGPITPQLPAMGDDGKKILDALASMRGIMTSFEGGSFGVVSPDAPKAGNLIQEFFVFKGDSAKIKDAESKMMTVTGMMMNAFMQVVSAQMGQAAGGGDLFKMTTTPNFKTVDNVALDRWQLQVDPDNTSPQAMQMSQSFAMIYGPDGLSVLGGSIDSKTFIGSLGVPDQLLSTAIEAAKSGQDVLSDTVKDINDQLPKKRSVVEYMGLGQYLSTILNFMKANGMQLNIAIPNNLPPIGMTVGADDSSFRVDGYVPTPLMQGVMQAGMQVYMQFNAQHRGGGGGAGGGGL